MATTKAPLIILGMHRSGTSMITSMLSELGLFIGHKLFPFDLYEAAFFVTLNEWLITQANASWDNTYNYQFVDELLLKQAKEIVIKELKGKKRKEFLGKHKFKDIRQMDIPWAWKDPRNTITIDLWKSIFPKARILHIYRNPIDVAASLAKRESEIRASKKLIYLVKIMRFLDYNFTHNNSIRVMHVEEGVKLWEEYVTKAFALDEKYGNDVMHLRYEDFLENSKTLLPKVAEFANLNPAQEKIDQLVQSIKSDRKFAFTKKPELVALYQKVRSNPWIQKLAYGDIPLNL